MKILNRILTAALLLALWSGLSTAAQDTFDPALPPDPSVPVFRYALTLESVPIAAGYVTGAGNYTEGTEVTVSTSAKSTVYTFNHWEKDGVLVSTEREFTYTVTASKATLKAVYDYTPNTPADPLKAPNKRTLTLNCEPDGACTFNHSSGEHFWATKWVSLSLTVGTYYEFKGWYNGETLVNSNSSFNYEMPDADVTLTARFDYHPFDPETPDNPDEADLPEVLVGDVNKDGAINAADVVKVINAYVAGQTETLYYKRADANGDDIINVADVVSIINKYLENE